MPFPSSMNNRKVSRCCSTWTTLWMQNAYFTRWRKTEPCDGRSSRALRFQRLQDKGEFVNAFCREFIQLQAFEDVDAVYREENLMPRGSDLGVGIWVHFHRPVVRTDELRVLFRKPFRSRNAN